MITVISLPLFNGGGCNIFIPQNFFCHHIRWIENKEQEERQQIYQEDNRQKIENAPDCKAEYIHAVAFPRRRMVLIAGTVPKPNKTTIRITGQNLG